jgi:hypothetical protein
MGGKCLVVYAENMDIEHYKLELMPSASVDLDNIFNYISSITALIVARAVTIETGCLPWVLNLVYSHIL